MRLFSKWIALVMTLVLICPLAIQGFAEEAVSSRNVNGTSAYTEANEVVYAVSAVNIRTGPGTENPIIGVLRRGKSVRRLAIGRNGWSKVMYQDQVAYIHSSYLTADSPEGASASLDDQELMRQIALVNGLNQLEYTTESWETVTAAMDAGRAALDGSDQKAVDAAAQTLKDAISGLVRMDYSNLEASLSGIQALEKEDSSSALWLELFQAEEKGKALLTSGDQAAVDAVSDEINGLLTKIKGASDAQTAPEVLIQEIPVEVPPSEDYCNISIHRVWQVLFFVSAALNVILAAVIVVYTTKKKRKQRDHTPLVDYDILDDTM